MLERLPPRNLNHTRPALDDEVLDSKLGPDCHNGDFGERGECTVILHFIAFWFIELYRCCTFYKLKTKPSASKKITTLFIVILILLW